MNFKQLKTLVNERVNLWPRPIILPDGTRSQMDWLVNRVDKTAGVVELLASSGHLLDVSDLIHHYPKAGRTLVLNAQVFIKGDKLVVEPCPWGATAQTAHHSGQPKWTRSVSSDLVPQQMVAARLQMLNGADDQVPDWASLYKALSP